MTGITPRDVAPGDAQRLQTIAETMAGVEDLEELPVDEAISRLEAAHPALAGALKPETERRLGGGAGQ